MDTKRLEQIAETFIVSRLQDAGILVAKPFFDQLGADLIGFTSIDDKEKFCRIQSKYRELKKSTSIKIDQKYVVGAFVLFLYIKYGGESHLFCFLPEDIHRIFRLNAKISVYRLSITPKILHSLDDDRLISLTREKIACIYEVMKASSANSELRILFSGLIEKFQKLSDKQRKLARLKPIMHEIEMKRLEKRAQEEKIEILEEHLRFLEQYSSSKKGNDK